MLNNCKNLFRQSNIKLIIILILFILLSSQVIYSQEDISSIAELNDEEIYLRNFVENIYLEYANMNFQYVYQILHPDIKDIITEEEYVYFQNKEFKKYKIQLSEIVVGLEVEKIKLPNKFKDVIIDIKDKQIYKIPLSYKMDLTFAGGEQRREVDNQVYILVDKQQYYLLWDPSVIKKEDKEAEEK